MKLMKRIAIGILGALTLSGCGGAGTTGSTPAIPADKGIEERVREILSGMTLEDKIGQMCEI